MPNMVLLKAGLLALISWNPFKIGHCIYKSSNKIVIAYIDFSKVFDVVSHNKLFIRLQSYGICGTILVWLRKTFSPAGHSALKSVAHFLNLSTC